MVRQDVNQLVLVFWLQKRVQRSSWKCCKCRVHWSEDGKWSWGTECVNQVTSNHCRNKRAEVVHRLCQFHNVHCGLFTERWWKKYSINDMHNSIGSHNISSDNIGII